MSQSEPARCQCSDFQMQSPHQTEGFSGPLGPPSAPNTETTTAITFLSSFLPRWKSNPGLRGSQAGALLLSCWPSSVITELQSFREIISINSCATIATALSQNVPYFKSHTPSTHLPLPPTSPGKKQNPADFIFILPFWEFLCIEYDMIYDRYSPVSLR